MNLADCLAGEPLAYLRGLARQLALPATALGHADLAASLAEHLKTPEVLARTVGALDDAERAALQVITFAGGGRGIVMEQCHQRINQVTGRRRRNGAQVVATLMGRGLVFVSRFHYRQHYLIPGDLQALLALLFGRELLNRVALDPAAAATADGVREEATDPYALLRWVCQFLSYCRKTRVELTQAGTIYRRTQRRLLQIMGQGQEEPAEEENGEGVPQPAHPEPLDFVLNYCRGRGLAELEDGALVPTADARPWMEASVWDRRRDLLSFWRDARLAWDLDVQAVLSVLLSLPAGTWVDLGALFRELEPMASDLYRGSLRHRLGQRVIRHLVLQGMLVLGKAGDSQVCRLTRMGRSLLTGGEPVDEVTTERRFFVQPNFELLVPSRLDTDLLWRIEECADLEKPDWMMVYRLTRATVYRALTLGRRPEELAALLEEHSLNELPQNVSFSIRDWPAAYGRLWFAKAFVLHCDTPALADELAASSSVGRYVRGRLSPTVLVVDRRDHEQLMTVLEEEGYMPAPGVRPLGGDAGGERIARGGGDGIERGRGSAGGESIEERGEGLDDEVADRPGLGTDTVSANAGPVRPAKAATAAGSPRRSRPQPGLTEPGQL
ncbi:MAG: helicase-associated domain-containing protein [Bacillota bacterium]|nr:helicase-associated domain-containing protein [Bacillota bacterium]